MYLLTGCKPVVLAGLVLAASGASAFNPAAGDFSKKNASHVRMVTWNVLDSFIWTASEDAAFKRVLEAINPDVIAFQEINGALATTDDGIETRIKQRLETYASGYTWDVHVAGAGGNGNKTVLCSRYPMNLKRNNTIPGAGIRGACIARVNLPDANYSKDLYLMNVHFKCCDDSADDHRQRQVGADAIINWMRDARTAGGNINLPAGTPMILTGDTNLLNRGDRLPYHPSKTLIDGTIYDTATYGASSPPDWDGTDMTETTCYDHTNSNPATHSSSDPVARTDRFYYTDSVLRQTAGFVLNAATMSASARTAAGLQANDTKVADHMPVIVDFAVEPEAAPGNLVINEFCANDLGGDDRSFIEIKNTGGIEVNLDAPTDYWIKQGEKLPGSAPSGENEQFAFNIKGVVPPGGLFVLYDGAHESSAIKATIENALPALQRQNLAAFILDNDVNSAFALVEQGRQNVNVTRETLVEAYGYAAESPVVARYMRTASGNNLLVNLGVAQWTTYNADAVGYDESLARNPGNTARNTYTGWTIGTMMSPGTENAVNSAVGEWCLY